MASKASTMGDPRRPQEIKKYKRPPTSDDALQPAALLAMMLGMSSLLLRQKLFAWASIFVSLVSYIHGSADADYKQTMMGMS
eukprot:gene11651-11796_t